MARGTVTPKPDSFDTHVLPNRSQLVSSGVHCPPVRTAAHPLDTFTDPASTRSHQRYDWRTGQSETVHDTILGNARAHMGRTKIHTVTSTRTHPDRENEWGGYGCSSGLAAPAPPLTANKSSAKKAKR